MEGGAAGPSNRGPFEYSNIAFASNTEVKLLSHLLIHHAYSTDTKKSLITAVQMVLEDSQDYDTTSPVEQGPWTIPLSWGARGSPLDLCGDFLVAATSLKAGYLAPVELIVPSHLGIFMTARCIVNYRTRLFAPRDSVKPKALLIPSFDPKQKVGGWVGGWGYNIWVGVQHNMWVGVKKCWGGGVQQCTL